MEQAKLLAPLGNADAQFYLGKMYAEGKGTLQRNTYAHMWFNLASANGHGEAATERDALTEKMTPTAIQKAQELAAACLDSDYQDCSLGKKPKAVVAKAVVEDTVEEYTADNKATIKSDFRGQSLLKRKQIQFALRKLNYYSSSVDGIWGKRTEQALVSFGQTEKLNPSDTQGIFKSILSKVDVPSSFAVARKKTTDPLELSFEGTCKSYGHRENTASFNQCVGMERYNYKREQKLEQMARDTDRRAREAEENARRRHNKRVLMNIIK